MIGRAMGRVTRKGVGVVTQAAGAAAVVLAVGLLAGIAWAVLAGGIALVAAGALAEAG